MTYLATRMQRAFAAIDAVNRLDPNRESVDGRDYPRELIYSQRMTDTLRSFAPDASELLHIATRAQHIERWKSPRGDYPEGRSGYKQWRAQLALFHGQRAGELMRDVGYSEEEIERVQFLLQKRQLKRDADTQTLEDVICLVFLQHYFEDFANKHEEDKLIDIVRKTWNKMSDKGHQAALKLHYSEKISALLQKSLA